MNENQMDSGGRPDTSNGMPDDKAFTEEETTQETQSSSTSSCRKTRDPIPFRHSASVSSNASDPDHVPMTVPVKADSMKFWDFKLAHVLTIIGMLAIVVSNFIAFDRRIGRDEDNIGRLVEQVRQLTELVGKIDSTGTQASQRGIMRDSDAVESNTRRIESLEKAAALLLPKMERIDANVDWITKWIQTQEAVKKVGSK